MEPLETINETTALILILAGILSCLAGQRIFKIILAVWGFIIGFLIVLVVFPYLMHADALVVVISATIGGIVVAGLLSSVFRLGIFVIGALLGYMLYTFFISSGLLLANPILLVLISCVGGLIALFLERPMVILSTAVSGAFLVAWGSTFMLGVTVDILKYLEQPELLKTEVDANVYIVLGLWAVLSLVGIFVQFRYTNKPSSK